MVAVARLIIRSRHCLLVCSDRVEPAQIVDRALKANDPWSISVCQLAEETAGKIEKACALVQLGQCTTASVIAQQLWLAYNHYTTDE